jgi:anti-anti-sigma regulatory factor
MDADALTVNAVRDGPVSTLILCGDLYLPETGGFLQQAALAVDDRTERLVFDLAGVTFLDCTGIGALSIAARLAPSGCTVIIRSLSPVARRIVELLGLDLANLRELSLGRELQDWLRDGGTTQQELAPVEPGTAFLAGTEGCP